MKGSRSVIKNVKLSISQKAVKLIITDELKTKHSHSPVGTESGSVAESDQGRSYIFKHGQKLMAGQRLIGSSIAGLLKAPVNI